MESVLPGLYASPPEPLPFAPSLTVRAFLLQRDRGNLLVYSTGTVAAQTARIGALGGVSRRYLNHWHEAGFGCGGAAEALGAPLYVHEDERASVMRDCEVAEVFSGRMTLDDDFEVIPTSGHTPGATTYLWDSGEHRFLFTGDTLYLDDGEWVAAVLESSDRDAYVDSLELIRELDFDVFVPWVATGRQPFHQVTDRIEARERVDRTLERVRRGETH
jgi:glyoxylase-like metal-dependent hydrolase (beta-lactamase superfamily II)